MIHIGHHSPINNSLLNYEVKVHWNTTKKTWSVHGISNKVVHMPYIILEDCKMKVSDKGRGRCLQKGVKNVHAFIIGKIINALPKGYVLEKRVNYNPFKYGYFYDYNTHEKIESSKYCVFLKNGDVAY